MKKKILIIASLLLGSSALFAEIKHPSLLFTPERVERAKQLSNNDSVYSAARKSIESQAETLLLKNDVRKMEYLALAYQLTGDRRYSDKLRDMLLSVSEIPTWEDSEMMQRDPAWRSELQMAHKAFQIAVAYDAIYNTLSGSDRKKIAQGVYRLAVEPLLGDWLMDPSRIHSLNSMGHNWWTSCVGMGGLLALAISNEVPEAGDMARKAVEALPEWFEFAGDDIQHKSRNFDREGGMYESINYASFGITEALLLRLAWLNSHPGSKLEDIPQMKKLASFFSHASYPREGMLYSINFGDSHKNVTGESSMLLAYAMGEKDPVALWYAKQVEPGQHREGFPIIFPMGFLYTPDLDKAPSSPDLPTSHLWQDFGWATMRDNWDKDATMLAVKSGMTWNHAHADANSLILFHKGTDIIKDAGNCSYGKPEYRNYFFQTDAHNVVKFNGKGQSRHQQYHGSPLRGHLTDMIDAGRIKYVMADGTGPMSQHLSRNMRHYFWVDNVIYIIDDLESHEPGQFEWLWHPGGETKKKGGDLVVSKDNSSVVIRPLYPQTLAPSNYVHDYPELLYWEVLEGPTEDLSATEEYYSIKMPQTVDKVKGVTAIILKDSLAQAELPVIRKIEGKNWIGLRMINKGKVTDIIINQLADGRLMHLNSWIEAEGWTTDAYMFAITYDEGKNPSEAEDIFIRYGSSLRRGDKIWFSSLAKLDLSARVAGKILDVIVKGQPRIKFDIRDIGKTSAIKVNGKKISAGIKNSLFEVSLKGNI